LPFFGEKANLSDWISGASEIVKTTDEDKADDAFTQVNKKHVRAKRAVPCARFGLRAARGYTHDSVRALRLADRAASAGQLTASAYVQARHQCFFF
jgi:hypothetical protein